MFVYYFCTVDAPFEDVEPALVRMLPGLRGWAADAYRDGEHLRAAVGPLDGARLAKDVSIDVGAPIRVSTETWIPLRWEATGASALFPTMDADIVIAAVGPRMTQVSLRGSYRVPLGPVGRVLDRMLLHRVAEASVKRFVDRIAHSLAEDPGAAGARARDSVAAGGR